jgi:uncharacterized integral membrane protein (TIGR00697 family)
MRPVAFPRTAVVVVAAYVGAQLVSNVASLKIGIVAGQSVDMGTFIYPITFTLRDVVHKLLGRRNARAMIVATAGANLFMVGYLLASTKIAADPNYALASDYDRLFSPLWRLVFASILAQVVAELVDTEVYHWWVTKVTRRYQWSRVLVSNSVSVPIDNLIFAVGAFGALPLLTANALTLPWADVWDIFLVNLVVKYLVTLCSLPFIYIAPDRDWSADADDSDI